MSIAAKPVFTFPPLMFFQNSVLKSQKPKGVCSYSKQLQTHQCTTLILCMLNFLPKRYLHCVLLKWVSKQVFAWKCSPEQRAASEPSWKHLACWEQRAGTAAGSMLEPAGLSWMTLHQCSTQTGFKIGAVTLLPTDHLPLDLSIPLLVCSITV